MGTLFKSQKNTPKKISKIPFTEVALEMVNANMGMMCVPKWALISFEISEDLVYKRIGANGLKRNHFLVIRKSDSNKRYVQDFIANFRVEFSTI